MKEINPSNAFHCNAGQFKNWIFPGAFHAYFWLDESVYIVMGTIQYIGDIYISEIDECSSDCMEP